MMGVCLRGNGGNNLVQHREEDRNVFRAQAVGIGPTAEKCVHGPTPTFPGGRKTKEVEEIKSQASCDVVASHPLFAELFKEIGAKYPELAALVPQISKVAKAVVSAPKVTASPAEKREESLQALRKATNRSSAAEEIMRKHDKKLEATKKALEDLQAKTADLEEWRKEAYVELVRAQKGVAATRMAAPSGNGMDVDDNVDEADLRVRAAGMELARAKEESAAKRRKTNVSECDGSATAQVELERACVDANRASVGGKPSVDGKQSQRG